MDMLPLHKLHRPIRIQNGFTFQMLGGRPNDPGLGFREDAVMFTIDGR